MTVTARGSYSNAWFDTTSPYDSNEFSWDVTTAVGDISVGWAITKPYTSIPSAPPGYTILGSTTSGTTAAGVDTGSMSITVSTRERVAGDPATGYTTYTNPAQFVPQAYGNFGYGRTRDFWDVEALFAADTSTASTAISITFGSTLKFSAGQYGLFITASPSSTGTMASPVLTIPGCTLSMSTFTLNTVTTSNKMRWVAWQFSVTAGSATGPATFTATANTSANSSVPAALVSVKEASVNKRIGASSAVTVISPKAWRKLPRAKAGQVSVVARAGTVGYNLARTSFVTVVSPAATKTAAKRYGDMKAALSVSIPTSAVHRALDPATAASIGRVDGVEVQIWDPMNTTMLAIMDQRRNMEWLDDMNDVGQGRFVVSRFDPKATEVNLNLFNIVRFSYAGEVRYASRIENRQMKIVGTEDHASQDWDISGRGVLAMLGDAVLYPEYGVNAFTQKQRGFSYASREGPWYVASEWFQPRGMKMADVPADHPWNGMPEGWPDPEAYWLWPTDPNQLASPEPAWFRSYFTLSSPQTVTVFASGDDQVTLYVDGYPTVATVSGDNYGFKKHSSFSIRMAPGLHLIAAEVINNDTSLEEVVPTISTNEITPTYYSDSNRPYIGVTWSDGNIRYCEADGHVDGGKPGSTVFDGDDSTYWLSVGNYIGWTSDYEWVEGTFTGMKVTAVKIKVKGGPYDAFISLKNGGNNWNGSTTIPYIHRSIDAHSDIRYVRKFRIEADSEVTVNVDPQDADRIRVTLHATWDSRVGNYRWRAAMYSIKLTNETREGSYIRGGNFAGLLVTVATTDAAGAVTGFVHRSQPDGWLCKTGSRPGWLPAHVIIRLLEEAKDRNVLGTTPLSLGFTADVDSRGNPWAMARKDVSYNTGDDYVNIIRQLTEDSELDIWIEPASLVIHAAPKRGKDRTSEVSLRPGQSLEDLGIDSNRPMGTRMVVETEYGWMEVGDFNAETSIGRVEGFVSLGNALSLEEARRTTVRELSRFAMPTYDATVSHLDTLGPRPYLDYDIGDLVTVPTGFLEEISEAGVAQPATSPYRVLSIKISEGEAGDLKVSVETDREPYALTGPTGGGTGSGSDDDNGVPEGTTLLLISANTVPYGGDVRTTTTLTVNTNGAVYTGYEFDRFVVVNATGVQFVNCKFTGPTSGAPNTALLLINPAKSVTATRCTLLPKTGSVGLVGIKGPNANIVRCEIAMTTTGVWIEQGNVTVDNCWLHDMQEYSGSGAYGLQVLGGPNIDITGTRIDGFVDDAAIWSRNMGSSFSLPNLSNLKIRNCIFGSDSEIAIYVDDESATFQPLIPDLQITDNIFERGRQITQISVSERTYSAGTTVISGNAWSDGSIPPPHPVVGP